MASLARPIFASTIASQSGSRSSAGRGITLGVLVGQHDMKSFVLWRQTSFPVSGAIFATRLGQTAFKGGLLEHGQTLSAMFSSVLVAPNTMTLASLCLARHARIVDVATQRRAHMRTCRLAAIEIPMPVPQTRMPHVGPRRHPEVVASASAKSGIVRLAAIAIRDSGRRPPGPARICLRQCAPQRHAPMIGSQRNGLIPFAIRHLSSVADRQRPAAHTPHGYPNGGSPSAPPFGTPAPPLVDPASADGSHTTSRGAVPVQHNLSTRGNPEKCRVNVGASRATVPTRRGIPQLRNRTVNRHNTGIGRRPTNHISRNWNGRGLAI